MRNKFYFSIYVNKEQTRMAERLVEFSLKNHPVPNIWDAQKKNKTYQLRMTGTIGEIVFADIYNLPRPTRSFGAIDGQDFGKDFTLIINQNQMNIDVKTMRRKSNVLYKKYVLNIPARNIHRPDSITNYYYCISLHEDNGQTIASVLGYIKKEDILSGKIGILYKKGTKRIRADKTHFTFYEDTYEIFFENISSPLVNEEITNIQGFAIKHLR